MTRRLAITLAFAFVSSITALSFHGCGAPGGGPDAGTGDAGTGDTGTGDTGTGDTGTGDTGTGDTGTGDADAGTDAGNGGATDFEATSTWTLDQGKELWLRFTPKFDGAVKQVKAVSGAVEHTVDYDSGEADVVATYYVLFQLTEASNSKTWPAGSYTVTVKYRKDGDTSDRTATLTATAGSPTSENVLTVTKVEKPSTGTRILATATAPTCVEHVRIYGSDGALVGVESYDYNPNTSACDVFFTATAATPIFVPANTTVGQTVNVWIEGKRITTAVDIDFGQYVSGKTVEAP